jgi:hypothetical protein
MKTKMPKTVPSRKASHRFLFRKILSGNRWIDLLIEMLVIFLSITLSFAFNEWQEKRKNRATEVFYLKQIRQNLESDIQELQTDINYYRDLGRAYAFYRKYDLKETTYTDSLVFYHRFFFYEIEPSINNTGYEVLRNTGKLDIITDKILLNKLLETYEKKLPSLQKIIEIYLQYKREILIPYLIKHFVSIDWQSGKSNLPALVKDPEFKNIYYHDQTPVVIERYQILLKAYQDLASEIQKEIAEE